MSVSNYPISTSGCVIRGTDSKKGRTRWLAPGKQAVRHLHYARIILDAGDAPVRFGNQNQETGLICLGRQRVKFTACGSTFQDGPLRFAVHPAALGDRESRRDVEGCDFAEVSARPRWNIRIHSNSCRSQRLSATPDFIFKPAKRSRSTRGEYFDWQERGGGENSGGHHIPASPATGPPGLRMSTRPCWRKRISTSICPHPLGGCNSSTPIRNRRSWQRWCAKEIAW